MAAKSQGIKRSHLSLICCITVLILSSKSSFSQQIKLHGDLGLQYSHFSTSHLDGITNGRPGYNLRFGAAFPFGKREQYLLGAEIGTYTRRMKRTMDEYHFINRFFTLEVPLFFRFKINQAWYAETGAAMLFYSSSQSTVRDADRSFNSRMGRGFQKFDVSPFIGGVYKFDHYFAIGGRARFGLMPMVEFQTIGDYGEMNPKQKDLYANTFEIFIRISNF